MIVRTLAIEPCVPQARFLAAATLTAEHPQQAIPYYQEVIAKDPDAYRVANALWNLAMCQSELGDFEGARASYSALLSRSDETSVSYHASARKNIGFNYYLQGLYAQARAELEVTIAHWPNSNAAEEAQRVLGYIAERERQAAENAGAAGGGQ